MEITPKLISTRLAQLKPGDLYLYQHGEGASVGLMVIDSAMDNDPCELALGPAFPYGTKGPHLQKTNPCSVVSFGPDFRLILPTEPSAWHFEAPPPDCHCVAIDDQTAYFRANWAQPQYPFRSCYINIQTGKVHVAGPGRSGYSEPPGVKAYASKWTLALPGENGAAIHSYEWSGPSE